MKRILISTRGGRAPAAGVMSLALLLFLGACGAGGPAYGPPAAGVAATVEMTPGLAFDPAEITVQAGATVEWRNKSIFTHTVTADPELAADPAHVALPQGAATFHSGPVAAGAVFRHTFATPGTYRYVCLPHEGFGMMGTVVVKPRS
ncbi:MAG: plastocyanin/azurin family copper-binding protein [Kiloniellaceae bacterium]